jgi:RimJ/RimL family protein N-acetyltransferase
MPMMEAWLRREHVAPFFECPESWLAEIRAREAEFSFVKHFIVMLEDVSVGFCQYYDCHHGREYEDWYKAEAPGELFGMDYLIGEPELLHQGHGKTIVRLLTERIRALPDAKAIVVQADADNIPSRKALEANGYEDKGDFYELRLG